MQSLLPFLRDAFRLARPYFTVSEERWSARVLLASVLVMNLSLVGMNVVLSYWNREFFNSLQEKNFSDFLNLLFTYRMSAAGFMPGFVGIVTVYILVAVYRTYLQQALQIRWRRWLTRRYLDEWLAGRAYYHISLTSHATDNPDQRIAEDVRGFVDNTLSLGLSFISNIVSLLSFLGILWSLSGSVTLLGVTIPGYMLWVALIYAVVGTWLTHMIGRPLVRLNFQQQQVEADFRYALVRVRENMEGIALYSGEAEEKGNLLRRFAHVFDNWWAIMRRTKKLNSLIFGYNQIAVIFPFVVAAPRYFSGALQLGGLTQTADAFGRVQDSLSWFISAYSSLAEWRAGVQRLLTFDRAIEGARALLQDGVTPGFSASPDGTLRLDGLALKLPDGTELLGPTSLPFPPGHSVVVTGRSGSGKSTLMRALAGIWPFGAGRVARPVGRYLFLPQRPYIPLGTLEHAVIYPASPGSYSRQEVLAALQDVGLGGLAGRLDEDDNWAQRLSGGEQQRLAFARALLTAPDWLFLDEATASLDPEAEKRLYTLVKQRLPNTTIVSIAHRPAVAAFHDERLELRREDGAPGQLRRAEVATAAD